MEQFIESEIKWISVRMKEVMSDMGSQIPSESTVNQNYIVGNNEEWTCGFWVGISWLLYEVTEDEFFYKKAIELTRVLVNRLENNINIDHHDIGFLYSLSIVPAYYNSGDDQYLKYIQAAGDKLISRFQPKGEFIQSWGKMGENNEYRFIIDSLLNIPFLYTCSNLLNDNKYKEIADMHYNTVFKHVLRDDFTTYHTFYFDPETGNPLGGTTAQGYTDDSCWARGQAWAISGIAFNEEYTNQRKPKEFEGLLNVFLNNIPDDGVVYWDFAFSDKIPSAKDTSANSIVACALLERAKNTHDESKLRLQKAAEMLVKAVSKTYSNQAINATSLISGCTYSYPDGIGINEASLWGDYFYLEALVRMKNKEWKKYW